MFFTDRWLLIKSSTKIPVELPYLLLNPLIWDIPFQIILGFARLPSPFNLWRWYTVCEGLCAIHSMDSSLNCSIVTSTSSGLSRVPMLMIRTCGNLSYVEPKFVPHWLQNIGWIARPWSGMTYVNRLTVSPLNSTEDWFTDIAGLAPIPVCFWQNRQWHMYPRCGFSDME